MTTTIYANYAEAVEREIAGALGEHAGDFDLDAIADELLEWHDELDNEGNILRNHSGLRAREVAEDEFWEIVARHELSQAD